MSQATYGLDFSPTSIRTCSIIRKNNTLELAEFSYCTLDGQASDYHHDISLVGKSIEDFLQTAEFPITQAPISLTLPLWRTDITRIDEYPNPTLTLDELEDCLEEIIEKYLPLELDDFYIDSGILDRNSSTIKLLLIASQRNKVLPSLSSLNKYCSSNPVLLDAKSLALWRVYIHNYEYEDDDLSLLVDASPFQTSVVLLNSGIPVSLWSNLWDEYCHNPELHELIKVRISEYLNHSVDDNKPPLFTLIDVDVITKVAKDLSRIIDIYLSARKDKQVKKVYISGEFALFEQYKIMLESYLDIPVERLNPFKRIKLSSNLQFSSISEFFPVAAISVGSCLSSYDKQEWRLLRSPYGKTHNVNNFEGLSSGLLVKPFSILWDLFGGKFLNKTGKANKA